jgi:hypothetical protein
MDKVATISSVEKATAALTDASDVLSSVLWAVRACETAEDLNRLQFLLLATLPLIGRRINSIEVALGASKTADFSSDELYGVTGVSND